MKVDFRICCDDGGAAISWMSTKQEVVALSSTKSEYISLSTAAKESAWIIRLVSGFDLSQFETLKNNVHNDNQGAMDSARNGAMNRRTSTLMFVTIIREIC